MVEDAELLPTGTVDQHEGHCMVEEPEYTRGEQLGHQKKRGRMENRIPKANKIKITNPNTSNIGFQGDTDE